MSFSAHYLSAVLLTILSLPTSLWAQAAPKQTTKTPGSSISGRVTIKEKGVAGVMVALRKIDFINPYESLQRAVTDQDGFYRIANVAPGNYEVSPSVPAFVPADMRESHGKTVLIGEDENIEDINFALVRGGVITGGSRMLMDARSFSSGFMSTVLKLSNSGADNRFSLKFLPPAVLQLTTAEYIACLD